jgi:gliding motility-associated-like protein
LTCPNTPVTLDAGSGFDSYLWQDGSTLSTYTTQQAGNYHVKVTKACAKAQDTAAVAFYAGIDPTILNLQPSYCISNTDVPLTATPAGGAFSGSIVTGTTIHLGNLNTGTYTIEYTYQDGNNCFRKDTKQVTITDDCFFIPNLITPNNDGPNDAFHVIGIGKDYTLEIYNRWGDLIYKKENYDNSFKGDGVSDGVYFFSLTHPSKDKKYKGWVHIVDRR